ncbi:MAG: 50S ribosomal protein L18e [Zestosphaera sp.]
MARTGPTNIVVRSLIDDLRKTANRCKAPIWDYVAEILEKPSRRRVVVNVSKLSRVATEGEVLLVPGKVLGSGLVNKRVTVAALSFSSRAVEKIKGAGGEAMSIKELMSINPQGSGVRVIA